MDGGVEITMIQVHINDQKHYLGGGGVPSKLDRIPVIEVIKELGEVVGTMRPKKDDVIDKMLPEACLLKSRMKEVHEQVDIENGH